LDSIDTNKTFKFHRKLNSVNNEPINSSFELLKSKDILERKMISARKSNMLKNISILEEKTDRIKRELSFSNNEFFLEQEN